jgi:hypothetical protein
MSNESSEAQDKILSPIQQSRSRLYQLFGHEDGEMSNLPIEPNLLDFKDPSLEKKFKESLFSYSKEPNKISPELSYNLLVFFVYFICFMILRIACTIALFFQGLKNIEGLIFQLIFIFVLIGWSLLLLYFIIIPSKARNNTQMLISILGGLLAVFFVIGDSRVFNEMIGDGVAFTDVNNIIPLIAFMVRIRHLLFDSFKHVLALSLFTAMLYLSLFIAFAKQTAVVYIEEFLVLVLFLGVEVMDSNLMEYRTKQIFYRKIKEEESSDVFRNEISSNLIENNIKTEMELVIKLCDEVKETIKAASNTIMFKETKKSMKRSLFQIDEIKRRIAQGNIKYEIMIEKSRDIDDDDKQFLAQNFIEKIPLEPSKSLSKRTESFVDNTEHVFDNGNFPFKDYGLQKLESVLFTLGRNWNFDIWFIYDSTGHNISIIGKYLMQHWTMNEKFNVSEEISDAFFRALENNYLPNPYHNACHAADVLHSTLFFILNSQVINHMTSLDILSSIIAALAHDIQHPALTNRFLVNTRDKLAIQYNDNSVLENMHISKLFTILNDDTTNLFLNLTNEEYFASRRLIVEMILSTDMTKHFALLGSFRSKVGISDISLDKDEDKMLVLQVALKCADLGHSAKISELHFKWTKLVCEEFFNQGDIEKARNLPVSMYCDRDSTNVPKSQAGFLKNVCIPLYETFCSLLNSESIKNHCLGNLKKNLAFWESRCRTRRATEVSPHIYRNALRPETVRTRNFYSIKASRSAC